MDDLEVGAAVRVKSLGVIFESQTSKGTATYSAGRGRRFIILLLGSEADSEVKDPKELLRELGWQEKAATPAEIFHPGEFVQEEIHARGWNMETAVQETQLKQRTLEELIAGHVRVTPVIARCLSTAFGTGTEIWINLQRSFDEKQ